MRALHLSHHRLGGRILARHEPALCPLVARNRPPKPQDKTLAMPSLAVSRVFPHRRVLFARVVKKTSIHAAAQLRHMTAITRRSRHCRMPRPPWG